MTADYFDLIKDYVHPNVKEFIFHYKNGNRIELPPCHGCNRWNRNGTRKFIDYTNGHQCVAPSWKHYWKKDIKTKYKTKYGFFYWTRYMTQTRDFYFKIKATSFIIIDLKSMNMWMILQCIRILNKCNYLKKNFYLKMPCHKKQNIFLLPSFEH